MVNRWFPPGSGLLKKAEPDMKTTSTAVLMFRLGTLIFRVTRAY
jgi:hypothetical protein